MTIFSSVYLLQPNFKGHKVERRIEETKERENARKTDCTKRWKGGERGVLLEMKNKTLLKIGIKMFFQTNLQFKQKFKFKHDLAPSVGKRRYFDREKMAISFVIVCSVFHA